MKAKLIGFFHGIDPATQGDFYTDVVHALFEKPKLNPEHLEERFTWLPFLVDILRQHHMDPNRIIDLQIKMFNRYPPMLAEIDSSREDFLSAALVKKYGETKMIQIKFGNTGSTNTKFHLKQVGYSYINSGYQWPNYTQMETNPELKEIAKLIKILKTEMMHEQVEYTDTNRVTFRHPVGKHNDLVHGWEMSLDAVMQFQQKNLGYEKRTIDGPQALSAIEEIYKDYPTEEIVYDEWYDREPGSSVPI